MVGWLVGVGQRLIALAVGAGGGCLDIFSLVYHFSFLSPSLWETARYILKYCLKVPLTENNQPTNQIKPIQDDFQHAFARMTDEADSSIVLADAASCPFRVCNNQRLRPWGRPFSCCPDAVTNLL